MDKLLAHEAYVTLDFSPFPPDSSTYYMLSSYVMFLFSLLGSAVLISLKLTYSNYESD